ncbi:MAG TPA: nuclear transport factor 2 family protein [Steroidobacteraceae bacterium]|nr:nuclear transport factor 2 family protein [Steroidobacteraceae bacterium]
MTEESRATALDRMLARDAIRDVLARYARAIDRADTALLKSCYFEDAIEEHGSSFNGLAHAYVDAAIPKVRTMGVMQHLLGNSFIDLDGDRAYVETYIWTFLRVERDGRSWDTFTGGRLHDRFERRNGTWKIAHRRTVFDWNRDTPSNEGWCLGYIDTRAAGVRRGRKDELDPTYERF